MHQLLYSNEDLGFILYRYGIDMCCQPQVTLKQALDKQNANLDLIKENVLAGQINIFNEIIDYDQLTIVQLLDKIGDNYYAYFESNLPLLHEYIRSTLNNLLKEIKYLKETVHEFEVLKFSITNYLTKAGNFLIPYIENIHEAQLNKMQLDLPKEIKDGANHSQFENMQKHIHNHLHKLRNLTAQLAAQHGSNDVVMRFVEKLMHLNFKLGMLISIENNYLYPRIKQIELKVAG